MAAVWHWGRLLPSPGECRSNQAAKFREFLVPRLVYLICGFVALGIGGVGVVVPLLPTVPLFILAAFCFARSHKGLEQWLLLHPKFGPSILLWRERGAISRAGKRAALIAFAVSSVLSLFLVPLPWALAPLAAALIIGSWIWRRAEG